MKPSPRDEAVSRKVAAEAVARMTQIPLTPEQQRVVCRPAMTALRLELWRWAARPIGVAELLRDIERYERTTAERRSAVGRRLPGPSVSPSKARRRLAARVNAHYRNANLRFSVGEEFLNDLIPQQQVEYLPVNETVTGRPVQGNSLAETRIAVRLVPDPQRPCWLWKSAARLRR